MQQANDNQPQSTTTMSNQTIGRAKFRRTRNILYVALGILVFFHVLLHLLGIAIGTGLLLVGKFFLSNRTQLEIVEILKPTLLHLDPEMPTPLSVTSALVIAQVMDWALANNMFGFGIACICASIVGLLALIPCKRLIHVFHLVLIGLEFCATLGLLIWVIKHKEYFISLFQDPILQAITQIPLKISMAEILQNSMFMMGQDPYCCKRFAPHDPECLPGGAFCLKMLKNYELQFMLVYVTPLIVVMVGLVLQLILTGLVFHAMKKLSLLKAKHANRNDLKSDEQKFPFL